MTIAELLDALWQDYVASAPQAEHIRHLLAERGEIVRNHRVALWTYGAPGLGDALARPFEALGWRPREDSAVFGPGLRARCWQHDDTALPGVVIGELAIEGLSPGARAMIDALIGQLPAAFAERGDLAWAGRPWRLAYAAYQALRAESEHAAWIAAFGFRVHHFTIDAGALTTFPDLEALAAFLVEHGFVVDDHDGAIQARPDRVATEFTDATVRIPSGGYEVARGHRAPAVS